MDHSHKKDPEVVAGDKTTNFKWPDEATKIIEKMLKNNHNRPHVIRRALKESNVFGTNMPSKVQLYNKVAATKKSIFPSTSVRNTHQLRLKIADLLEEPASDLEAFVPHYEIDDVDENKDPRFNIFFSSKKNLRKLKSDRLLQTDATYRLNWLGFPVYVVGKRSLELFNDERINEALYLYLLKTVFYKISKIANVIHDQFYHDSLTIFHLRNIFYKINKHNYFHDAIINEALYF